MARVLADGVVVKHDHNSDSSFTTLNQVASVELPDDFDFNETEVTALSDTTEQHARSMQKGKQCKVNLYWDESDTGHTNLRTGASEADGFAWEVTTSDETPKTISFDAFILKLGETTLSPKGAVMKAVTLRLTSEPSYA